MEYCKKHKPPMPFAPCKKVEHKGKETFSTCGIKKSHPKHTHCTGDTNGIRCQEVSGLKHPSYKWRVGGIA